MAEFVLKDMIKNRGLSDRFIVSSSATSTEEIGSPVHRGTKKKLAEYGISADGKYAVQLRKSDYEKYDYIIAMDSLNIRNIMRIIGEDTNRKVSRLLDFSENPRDIADP